MKPRACCRQPARTADARRDQAASPSGLSRRPRRFAAIVRWLLPGAILALMPKCPACLAMYVALWTGIGLSASAAAGVRTLVIVLCVLSLLVLTAALVRRLHASLSHRSQESLP